jgi:hypothetical protein
LEFDKNFDAALKRVFFQDITLMWLEVHSNSSLLECGGVPC